MKIVSAILSASESVKEPFLETVLLILANAPSSTSINDDKMMAEISAKWPYGLSKRKERRERQERRRPAIVR